MHDVIIIGAGAAGLSAAIYATRKQLKTLVVSKDFTGGQTSLTNGIENYPGVRKLPGPELMKIMLEQAKEFGAELKEASVVKVHPEKDKTFTLHLEDGSNEKSRAVILTFGVLPRPLNIPGEQKFFGRGVSTCATCDAPFFKNKTVAIVGGGNAGVEAALELGAIAKKVYLIHRREEFRADEITVKKVKGLRNVELVLNSVPIEIIGDKVVKAVKVSDLKTDQTKDIPVDGFFIEIGHMIDSSMVKGVVDMNEAGEIVVDGRQNTSYPGIFAAGDATPVPYKQTVIAAGQGAIAALDCYRYLTGPNASPRDWA